VSKRLASIVTEAFSPAFVVIALPLAVAWQATEHRPGATVLWGAVVATFYSVLPMIFIVHGARRGRWDGHHVRDREHRRLPMLMCLVSALAGLAILLLGDAPRNVLALSASMIATLLVCMAITHWWKVSLHATVAGGAVATVVLLYGPWLLLLIAPLILVCWSRVKLTDHTVTQVVVGALLGPLVGGAVFLLLRN
jgi:membrane-associated phospholipid phosphatase